MNEQLKSRIEALNKTDANLALKQTGDKYSLEANGFRIAPLGTENEIEMFLRGYAKAQEAIFKPVLPKVIRRLRILEYVGSQEWIDTMIANRKVKGTKIVGLTGGSIREAMLGDTNETLIESEIEQIEIERKQSLDKQNKDIQPSTITLKALWHLLFPEGTHNADFANNDVSEWIDAYTEEVEKHTKSITKT